MKHRGWPASLLGAGLVLQGCAHPPPHVSTARLYAIDFAGGAKVCTASKVDLSGAAPAGATLTLGNDGGWCALQAQQADQTPFAAGLVVVRPAHGHVFIHTVGEATRIDYTPVAGFEGRDSFTVRLLPGTVSLPVAVTVTAPPSAGGTVKP